MEILEEILDQREKFNNNIRCIEISLAGKKFNIYRMFNNNIKCIEIALTDN